MAARPDHHDIRAEIARCVDDRAGGSAAHHRSLDTPGRSGEPFDDSGDRVVELPRYRRLEFGCLAKSTGPRAWHGRYERLDDAEDPKNGVVRPGDPRGELNGLIGTRRAVICKQDTHWYYLRVVGTTRPPQQCCAALPALDVRQT